MEKERAHRLDDSVDHLDAGGDFVVRVSSNKTVKIFFGIFSELIRSSLPLLHGALAADTDLGTALPFHLLQTVTTRPNQEPEEVDFRELLDWDVDLVGRTLGAFHLMILHGGTEVGVVFHGTVDEPDTLLLELLAVPHLTGVSTTTVSIIRRGRRGRAVNV